MSGQRVKRGKIFHEFEFPSLKIFDLIRDRIMNERKIEGAYLFGGYVRDCLLNQEPNDIDVKIVVPMNNVDRVANELIKLMEKLNLSNVVFGLPNGSKVMRLFESELTLGKRVDLVAVEKKKGRAQTLGTSYTANSVFVDVETKEFFSLFGAEDDLTHKKIRLANLKVDFRQWPDLLFRAIYLACKLEGFEIEEKTKEVISSNADKAKDGFRVLSKVDLMGEYMFDQMFGGLCYDPEKYIVLMDELGLLVEIKKGFQNEKFKELRSGTDRLMERADGDLYHRLKQAWLEI